MNVNKDILSSLVLWTVFSIFSSNKMMMKQKCAISRNQKNGMDGLNDKISGNDGSLIVNEREGEQGNK